MNAVAELVELKRVLNVGGGTVRALPPGYAKDEWALEVLDIDPDVCPDICCDAKTMGKWVEENSYDSVHCSHALEHFYLHEVGGVLVNFYRALKPGGFVTLVVPDVKGLIERVIEGSFELTETWYQCSSGQNISYHDVLYGWGLMLAAGNEFYAHKCGFTPMMLGRALIDAGFVDITLTRDGCNLFAKASKGLQ